MLAGDLPADRGEVRRAGSVGVDDQQIPLGSTDTVGALNAVGDRTRPLGTLSVGATAAAVVIATHDRQLLRDTESWPRLAV